jgi:hypothetical protein
MTVFGKILVFVNLVFSLLTAGLIVMVFANRVNWKAAYEAQKAAAGVATTNVTVAEQNSADAIRKMDAQYQALKAEKDRAANEARTAKEDLDKATKRYEAMNQTHTGSQQVTKDQAEELARRKTEVEQQKKLVEDRDKKIAEIDRQMARLRDDATQYKIQWEQSKERIGILQGQVEQLARDNERLRQQLGGGGATTPAGGTAPAARVEDLRGTIQRVDGDLATITPGSDAGVAVGAELYVFRLQPKPEFLGKLTILNVTPTQAVGRLTGPKSRQVKASDEVAANLGGGR